MSDVGLRLNGNSWSEVVAETREEEGGSDARYLALTMHCGIREGALCLWSEFDGAIHEISSRFWLGSTTQVHLQAQIFTHHGLEVPHRARSGRARFSPCVSLLADFRFSPNDNPPLESRLS